MKKKPSDTKPAKGLQDMDLADIARMNLDAIKTGDARPMIRALEASIQPEPPRRQPIRYAIHVPLIAVDGAPCIGKTLRLVYEGEGPACELELEGVALTIDVMQLGQAIGALHQALCSVQPTPAFTVPGRAFR